MRFNKYWANRILIGFIIIYLCFAFSLNLNAQDRKKLEAEKAKIEREIAKINSILNETKKTKRLSASQLNILRKKIRDREKLIANISKQTQALNGEIQNTQKSIFQLNEEINFLKKEYIQMLRMAQKNKTSANRLLFIFSAKDYSQAYQRYVFFKQYGQLQKQKMFEIQQKTNELEKKTNELVVKKVNQESLLSQQEKQKSELTKEQRIKQSTINSLQKKERQLANQIKEKQARRKKLQNQINAAIQAEVKRQAQIAAKSKTKDESKTSSKEYVMSATPEEIQLSKDFTSNKGRLPWPTEHGIITSNYGTHPHPDIKGVMIENLGVDIRTKRGSSVRAVFDGEVVRVFTGPNGQKVIILRHGEYMTVYTNLSNVFVSAGNKVKTKQSIGTIHTNTEDVTEINFQVWKGNNRQNPSTWIKL
ncbi:MAG: peptidoglycan DD-metalloendopeptidase family protein [Bacteroidales bacterium]|jgi:septal ring factor EnvC (AmiA/AmiB activator)|nr:peptidoglycan DD-metalloendopeptidase family protein [Bacteroidales bacterium]